MNYPIKPEGKDDPTWESVLESLAQGGHLSRFYKIPRHELAAMMKLYSRKAVPTLGHLFALTQAGEFAARERVISGLNDHLRYVMLCFVVRSMKCWVETESFLPTGAFRGWRVAHS